MELFLPVLCYDSCYLSMDDVSVFPMRMFGVLVLCSFSGLPRVSTSNPLVKAGLSTSSLYVTWDSWLLSFPSTDAGHLRC